MRKNLHLFFLMILLVQGCQEPTTSHIDHDITVTEMTSDLQSNELHYENDYLLTKDEAKQALFEMAIKEEEARRILSNIGMKEHETILKIDEENKRKEKELMEMAEQGEDVEQSLLELRKNHNEQVRTVFTHYNTVTREFKLARARKREFEDIEFGDVEYDKLFEDRVLITIIRKSSPERSGDWECDLKNGWFQKSTSHAYFGNTVTGRFWKDRHGEWNATILSFSGGDRAQ